MSAVATLWWSQARRGWRSWLAVTLVIALGAGAGFACLSGARRTASWFDRVADVNGVPFVNSSHGVPPREAEDIVASFEGITDHSTVVGFTGFVEDLDPTLIKFFIGAWEEPLRLGRPILEEGVYPDPDDPTQVLLAGRRVGDGIDPGDELTVRFFLSDFSAMVSKTFVVAGIGEHTVGALADSGQDRTAMYFTPAFSSANEQTLRAWSATAVAAGPGVTVADVEAQMSAVGWSVDETRARTHTRVQDALRPLLVTLAILGVLLLVAATLLGGQAIARRSADARRDADAVRAMGFTPRQLLLADLLLALSVAVPAALLAVAVAVALSPLAPVGAVRPFEPQRGIDVDATVLGIGSAVVALLLVVSHLLRGSRWLRDDRSSARPFFARAPFGPALSGLRLASGGTRSQRRQFWTTTALCSLALVLVVAGIAFAGALDRLTREPARYGVGWELSARNAYGDLDPDDLEEAFADIDEVDGFSAATVSTVIIDGATSPMLAVLPVTGSQWPTLVDGELPDERGEVMVGEAVLERIDAAIGDQVTLEAPYRGDAFGELGSGKTEVTIVGTAVFPSIDLAGVDPTRLDSGVAITWEDFQSVYGETSGGLPDMVFVDLADGADPDAVIEALPEGLPELTGIAPTEWLPSLAPAEVLEADRAQPLVWTVIALLAVTVLATIVHSLLGSVRQQRGVYAVLKTLGFTRRQVVGSVASQALVTVVAALVVAVPVGTALGRALWRTFAQVIGVIDSPVVPVFGLLAVVVASLLGAVMVAAGPGLVAARTRPAALVDE